MNEENTFSFCYANPSMTKQRLPALTDAGGLCIMIQGFANGISITESHHQVTLIKQVDKRKIVYNSER